MILEPLVALIANRRDLFAKHETSAYVHTYVDMSMIALVCPLHSYFYIDKKEKI